MLQPTQLLQLVTICLVLFLFLVSIARRSEPVACSCFCASPYQPSGGNFEGVPKRNASTVDDSNLIMNVWWSDEQILKTANWYYYMHEVLVDLEMPLRIRALPFESYTQTPGLHIFAISYLHCQKIVNEIAPKMGLKKYGLLITDNEEDDFDLQWLKPEVKFVLRPYYHPRIFVDQRHLWIPTGYFEGRGPRPPAILLKSSQRLTACWFSGSQRADREKMFKDIEMTPDHPCELTMTSGFAAGLGPREYSFKLADVIFALCPRGNSAETIRLYEAWENGAIPVMTSGDVELGHLRITHPNLPLLVVPDWIQAPIIMKELLRPEKSLELNHLQETNILWYQHLKKSLSKDIGQFIRQRIIESPQQ